MKEKKFYTIILCAVMMIMGITSCSEELLSESDTPNGYPSGEGQVSAVKLEGNGDIFARSSFLNGTEYRLVMFTRGFTATAKPVLTTDSVLRYNGLATETALGGGTFQYLVVNDTRHTNNEWFGFRSLDNIDDNVNIEDGRRSLSFYGFTYGKQNVPQLDENAYTRTEKVDDGGELNDLMWGILVDQNDSTAKFPCEIPFRHAFSRLEFKVSQLASEENSEVGMYDLGIESIAVTGTYKSGTVDLFTGKTTLNSVNIYEENGRKLPNMYKNYDIAEREYIGVKEPDSLGAMIVFPSAKESIVGVNEYTIGLKITLKGSNKEEVEKLVGAGNAVTSGTYYTGVYNVNQIYSSVYDGSDATDDGTIAATPLYLQSGSKYTLHIVLMKDEVRVVTVVPSKVEWLPGETDDAGNSFSQEIVGQPIFFDNTIWMDRNLGANEADPGGNYNQTIGYYYQNNRNIPYWPYKVSSFQNLETKRPTPEDRYRDDLSEFSEWGNPKYKVYPVMDEKVMNNDPHNENWRVGSDNINKNGYNYYYYTTLQKDVGGDGTYIFFTGNANVPWTGNSWEEWDNQPAPPGWALPTKEQFQSVFPTSVFAGNVTFLKMYHTGTDWNGETKMDKTLNQIRICVPFYKDANNSDKNTVYYRKWESLNDPGASPGEEDYYSRQGPYYYRGREPDGDPSPGYCSVYIISRKYDDEKGKISNNSYSTKEWGTIYGIKKVGTTEAYRMRWKVKNADITGTDPRLYVEVSMYSCTKDDNLTLDNYRNYNWDYPVSQMYFPLCGEVEGRSTTSGDNWVGAGFSSYGSAVLYATSTGNSALHVKITGDNPQNQYMSVISDEIQTNAKQIRLVKTQN